MSDAFAATFTAIFVSNGGRVISDVFIRIKKDFSGQESLPLNLDFDIVRDIRNENCNQPSDAQYKVLQVNNRFHSISKLVLLQEGVNDILGQTHNPASSDQYFCLKIGFFFCVILERVDDMCENSDHYQSWL